ncbi:EAL domain-containing protein [Hyphomonas sp. WL0036]|uniref:putative bifunctional diguanylate cyclase/phosphodiesterase n=1 Tax=Hyphomonas sediminis TaxID=2866160 RepID=UPI001C825DAD|nr:GGDEF domain-containing phosphodiesterase [Hyphomonas sediminis]MBY9065999.1 EAL domain-containing protein [Hyphomonas sediminis]
MKKISLLGRLISSLSIPAFVSLVGAFTALLLFVTVISIEMVFRLATGGNPFEFVLPVYLLLPIIGATVLIASGVGYILSRPLQKVFERFTEYMTVSRGEVDTDLYSLQFPELRRLRVATTRTVRKLRRENEHLRKIAYRDSRTGLPNAVAAEKRIVDTLPNASFERPAAFILLDIDRFAHLVEQVGAGHGEMMIHAAAQRISKALADVPDPSASALRGSMLAALTADQFTLYMPDAGSREHVIAIARAIRNAFNEPFTIFGRSVTISLSGGIVMAPEDADSPQKMMQNAKLALRLVRNESQSGFRFFTPRLTRIVQGRYRFESELRDAVENREFKAVFQPKIDFATGRIVGAEALARWRRSNGKLISPAAFIPVAEEAGLIEEIGKQILEAACEAARTWELEGHDVTVAVNVSPSQFQRNDLTETVMGALKRSGLHPRRLELEITESMAVSDPARVAEFISPLRAMGTKLAIDDFGTGHSNLATLTQLPFDVFKIDRQFVSALETDRQAPAIVEMILAMAETLGLKTVAEGVETTKQADFLRRRGCTMAQGFLYSPGLPDQAFLELLRAWKPLGANDETGSPEAYQAPRR